jgi:hypothetical protein
LISVIVYGRNDSYGYHLHKRAAISLNCIAEVLTHPGDEIIFVDCNTPDDMPTFPETIQDTLTPKAKGLIRVFRLRPSLYEKHKKGSPLKTLEPLSRNVALRRSNPSNRWILSTNTDMVFVVREPGKSLSDIAAELPDGFYELPRFEVPEALWETVNRIDPIGVIETFRLCGQTLHLNEVVISRPDIRFDGPGDFQFMLRDQIFEIHGFNEQMILGWHADSNLCRRLHLLNGRTESLLDHAFAYHCDHTRHATFLHSADAQRTMNDENRFVFRVSSPFLPEQAERWGIPDEEIEEIHLTDKYDTHFGDLLGGLLPGLSQATTSDVFVRESCDHGVIYDTLHVFPFLANHLINISPSLNIGYFGGNVEALRLMSQFFDKSGHRGRLFVNQELIRGTGAEGPLLPGRCSLTDDEGLIAQADVFIFDLAMMHFPQVANSMGVLFPAPSKRGDQFVKNLQASFLRCVESERRRLQSGKNMPRKFLFIGSQHTSFGGFASTYIGMVLTPYSTHVRHGFVKPWVSPFSITGRVKRQILCFGSRYKERIIRRPLLNRVAMLVYKRLFVAKPKEECPMCGARTKKARSG